MSAYQDVFKRYENKYLIDRSQFDQLKRLIEPYMEADAYGTHAIGNLYYDTDSFELIRHSIEKPVYKEKLRLRCYGIPKAGDLVFVEIKKKYKGVVYKRRTQMALAEACDYLNHRRYQGVPNQILNEIDWFMNLHQLSPKVFIGYDRTAYFGREDPALRITFDQNVRFRENELDLSQGSFGKPLIDSHQMIMEIKIPGVLPLWLSQMLTQLAIYPNSFSKYGNCYKNYLMEPVTLEGGKQYA